MFGFIGKKSKQIAQSVAEHHRKIEEWHASTEFTEEEKIICDIIIKSDFSKCNVEFRSNGDIYNAFFVYNNLKLEYYMNDFYYGTCFILKRVDNDHLLKEIKMGEAKLQIIDKIIKDKFDAYVQNSITSAFNDKSKNADDCPYCGTKNPKDKINCINCGAVITYIKN